MGPFFPSSSVLLHPKAITNGQLGALSLFRSPPPSQYTVKEEEAGLSGMPTRGGNKNTKAYYSTLHFLIACVMIEKEIKKELSRTYIYFK